MRTQRLKLEVWSRFWPYREPLVLSRGRSSGEDSIQVRLTDEAGRRGRGEAIGVTYAGESPATMAEQLETVRPRIEAGISRDELLKLLPSGGARLAVDSAVWDMEAKRDGLDPFAAAGTSPRPITSMCTIGVKGAGDCEAAARRLADYPVIKLKVDGRDPLAAIAAVRRGAPHAGIVVDPNQAWSVDQLKALAPALPALGVILLEQPIPVGHEPGLDGWPSPVPLCADELIDVAEDLSRAEGRFRFINVKLDKAGGLTAALRLANAVEARGMELMVGCMMGSSLSMAPAMVLAQRAKFVDLDGPLLHSEDIDDGFIYVNGTVTTTHLPMLWG